MFFVLSKLLWMASAPANLLIGVLLAGVLLARAGRRALALRLLSIATIGLAACAILPLGNLLLLPLEDRFAPLPPEMAAPDGIIVLGGSIDETVSKLRGVVSVGDAPSRLTEAVALARRFPRARLIFTGGSAALVAGAGSEAEGAWRLWTDLGVDPDRITTESRSRNTAENATFTRDLVHPRPDQRWVLVTSAFHMPRSYGLFRAAGFDVIPDPVDYRTTGTWRDLLPSRDAAAGLARFDMAAREWIGLLAYRLTGRTPALLPGL